MAIQGSGQIKLTELATEFGGTAPYSLKAYYRGGGRVPSNNTNVPASGAIGLKNFYNAVNRVTAVQTFATNTTQTALNVSTLPGYIAGITDVTVYVSSNVYVYSTSTASPALTITGATAGDTITLINNGFIIGMGGAGASTNGGAGSAGGPAINLGYNISLTNNSYIAGGGGGGGRRFSGGGGGAGGGAGGSGDVAGGTGGSVGSAGGAGGGPTGGGGGAGGGGGGFIPPFAMGPNSPPITGSGGGGGRILPGTGGAGVSGGGLEAGGGGGSANNAGSGASASGGGGGWGAAGGTATSGGAGGAGGKAINLNGYTVTYLTTGTVYGTVS